MADKAVDSKEFRPTVTDDAPTGVPDSIVMFAKPKDSKDAETLADRLEPKLGKTDTAEMTRRDQGEVERRAAGAV